MRLAPIDLHSGSALLVHRWLVTQLRKSAARPARFAPPGPPVFFGDDQDVAAPGQSNPGEQRREYRGHGREGGRGRSGSAPTPRPRRLGEDAGAEGARRLGMGAAGGERTGPGGQVRSVSLSLVCVCPTEATYSAHPANVGPFRAAPTTPFPRGQWEKPWADLGWAGLGCWQWGGLDSSVRSTLY